MDLVTWQGSWTVVGPGKRLPSRLMGDVRVVLEPDSGSTAYGVLLAARALRTSALVPGVHQVTTGARTWTGPRADPCTRAVSSVDAGGHRCVGAATSPRSTR